MRASHNAFGLIFLEQEFYAFRELAHDLRLVRYYGGKTEAHCALTPSRRISCWPLPLEFSRVEKRLGRNAADIEAGSRGRGRGCRRGENSCPIVRGAWRRSNRQGRADDNYVVRVTHSLGLPRERGRGRPPPSPQSASRAGAGRSASDAVKTTSAGGACVLFRLCQAMTPRRAGREKVTDAPASDNNRTHPSQPLKIWPIQLPE